MTRGGQICLFVSEGSKGAALPLNVLHNRLREALVRRSGGNSCGPPRPQWNPSEPCPRGARHVHDLPNIRHFFGEFSLSAQLSLDYISLC
jgi:hypothetical protein